MKSVLLYDAPVWATKCLAEIEKVQLTFFKNLLYLPKSTPGHYIRLETDISHLKVTVFKQLINYWVKILQKSDDRLPCMVFDNLLSPVENEHPNNLTFQLKSFLGCINKDHLLFARDANLIIESKLSLFEEMENHSRNIDVRRTNVSGYNPQYILISSLKIKKKLHTM